MSVRSLIHAFRHAVTPRDPTSVCVVRDMLTLALMDKIAKLKVGLWVRMCGWGVYLT